MATGSGADESLEDPEGIGGTRLVDREGNYARYCQRHADFSQQRAALENSLVRLAPRLGGFLEIVGKVFSEEIDGLRLGCVLGRPLTLGYELFFDELSVGSRDIFGILRHL